MSAHDRAGEAIQLSQELLAEVQRLTQIIIDAQKALDNLDGVIALETWDDDEIPAAVRGAALAVRFRLERLHPDFHRSDG